MTPRFSLTTDRTFQAAAWRPDRPGVVICDMWDTHHCRSAERRVRAMAPRMSRVVERLRERGARQGEKALTEGGRLARVFGSEQEHRPSVLR